MYVDNTWTHYFLFNAGFNSVDLYVGEWQG